MKKVPVSKFQRGNRTLIKAMNRSLVLNTIRREGPLSRTRLTELSGLSVGTVSQITNDLIAKNWILEGGEGDYTGGRRQVMLKLNPSAGIIVGLKLMENRVVGAVTDLESRVLYYSERDIDAQSEPRAITRTLADIIEGMIAAAKVRRSRVIGVGIGLAGAVNADEGIVHLSPFFGWRDVPLAQMVEDRLNLPVYIDNDVNTLTAAEQLFGPGQHQANFVVVTVGRGIGMGMVIDHQVYQGQQGGAGELGHVTLEVGGPLCDCGKRGCLEALASDPAVIQYVRERSNHTTLPKTLEDVVTAAARGDVIAREALNRSGQYLGVGLATVVNMLCPSLLIISGEGVIAGDYRLTPMFEALREHTFNGLLDGVEIVVQRTDDRAWARGAASIVIGKLFESPRLDAEALAVSE